MQVFVLLILLAMVAGCDPEGFGYKYNPTYVLEKVHSTIMNLDDEGLREYSGKEALCLYGTPEGIQYLKEQLPHDGSDVNLNYELLTQGNLKNPEFIYFWSYYKERYRVIAKKKNRDNELIINVIMDCYFGFNSARNDEFLKLEKEKFKEKRCRVVKLNPVAFTPLKMTPKCESMKVEL